VPLAAGAMAGAWDLGSSPSWLAFEKPNFLRNSLAISSLALSVGWNSSQKIYLVLSWHNIDAGVHVKAGLICPKEQQGESEFVKPTNISKNMHTIRKPKQGELKSNFQ